ncbi:MAG: sialidase family protein [Kiritimatiellia bacterium]
MLVYDRALDDTERQSVEAHLTARWAGTVDGVNPEPPPPLVLTSQPFKSGTNGYHTFRIPAMVVSNQGTIIIAADGRLTSSGDLPAAIDCIVRRSTDRGDTWGPHIVVADYGTDTADTDVYPILGDTTPRTRSSASDPALLVDRSNGRIWILYDNGSPTSYAGFGRTIKLEMRHSGDDGLTWSPRIDVEADNPGLRPAGTAEFLAGPGNGIQLERGPHAGRLIFPVYWYRSDNHSTLILSDDHGVTWRRGGRCGSGVGEVQIVECVNGDLLASMRPSGAGAGYRWFSRSTDGGDTWGALFRFDATSPTPVPDPTCQGSLFRLSTPDESDANRLIHASPASTSSRVAMTLRMSRDEGASWPVARRVYAGGSAYSALARLSDGDIGLLFEKDGYQSIDFVRVRLDELTEGLETRTDYETWLNATLSRRSMALPSPVRGPPNPTIWPTGPSSPSAATRSAR